MMTETQILKELTETYGSFLYAREVAEYTRKSKSGNRVGKWLEENEVDYFVDGKTKKYYAKDVARAIAKHRVPGYLRRVHTSIE